MSATKGNVNLRSASELPEIRFIEHLYKIGFSTTPVDGRIKNARQEPICLMAPVKIVSVFECYNLNPQKFEALLHTFFGTVCLELTVTDSFGKPHTPREWFIAPLDSIELAAQLLINGEIVHYRYDPDLLEVVERS